MGLLRYMNAGHGHFDLIGHLFFDRVFKFFIGIESSGIAGFQADVAQDKPTVHQLVLVSGNGLLIHGNNAVYFEGM